MQKFMKTIWTMVLAVFILLLIAIPFGLNSSLFAGLLGQYIIAPLLLVQIIVWIFSREKKVLYNNDTSLTKVVHNYNKDIASQVKPTVGEYKQKHTTSQIQAENQDIDEVPNQNVEFENDDAIYEQVMLEIEDDRKVKATWARALSQSDGDKDRAESIYIQFRVSAIKSELEREEALKKQQQEQKRLELEREEALKKQQQEQKRLELEREEALKKQQQERLEQEKEEELKKLRKFEEDKKKARNYHKNGGFNKLFKKELKEKGYKVKNNTRLSMRFGLFEVDEYVTVIDNENYLFMIIDKDGYTVDSFKYNTAWID